MRVGGLYSEPAVHYVIFLRFNIENNLYVLTEAARKKFHIVYWTEIRLDGQIRFSQGIRGEGN